VDEDMSGAKGLSAYVVFGGDPLEGKNFRKKGERLLTFKKMRPA